VSATIRQIVNEALTVVAEVSGLGAAVRGRPYEDDAVRAFNMMFKKYSWHQYLKWFLVTLDGVTGKAVEQLFERVMEFEDFIAVFRDMESNPLPIAPAKMNPFSLANTSSARPLYWTSMNATEPDYAKRKIMVYPATAQGKLNVAAKVYPLKVGAIQFDWELYFRDWDMLVYATAFMTLSGDDLNAGAVEVVRNMMEMKYKDVTASLGSHPIPIRGDASIPYYWQSV
jgi:hypothetical protein